MKGKERISYLANPALGLLPFLLYAFLIPFLKCKVAMWLVLGFGSLAMFFLPVLYKRKIFPFFLFLSNAVFLTVLILTFFIKDYYYDFLLPDLLVLLFVGLVLMNKHRFIIMMQRIERKYLHFPIKPSLYEFFYVVKVLGICLIVYIPIAMFYFVFRKPFHTPELHRFFLGNFRFLFIFLLMLFSFIRLGWLNYRFRSEVWLPILDDEGTVIGKVARDVSRQMKGKYMHPHVRVLIFCKGRLFMRSRCSKEHIVDIGCQDTPLGKDLHYAQDFPGMLHYMMAKIGGHHLKPRFFTRYKFEHKGFSRMIFLYTLIVPDENLFSKPFFQKGKLWTQQEIENNIGKGVFAEVFEEEYELLRNTVFPVMKMI